MIQPASRLTTIGILSAALVSAGGSRDASAYCLKDEGPFDLTIFGTVPVYLNVNMVDILCPDSGCTSMAQIERRATAAWSEIAENTNLRFSYMGTTTRPPGSFIQNGIHIFASSAPCVEHTGQTHVRDGDGDGDIEAAHIKICSRAQNEEDMEGNNVYRVIWGAGPDDTDNNNLRAYRNLQGLLTHELGHALGFKHPEQCDEDPDHAQYSVMTEKNKLPSSSKVHLFQDDIQGYNALYGPVTSTVFKVYGSTDGVNWSEGVAPPMDSSIRPLGRISACTSVGATVTTTHSSSSSYFLKPGRFVPPAWTFGLGVFGSSPDQNGVACGNGSSRILAWKQTDGTMRQRFEVWSATSSDGGVSWGSPTLESSGTGYGGRSDASAVSAAFDPRTGLYVMLWRADGFDLATNGNAVVSKVKAAGAIASKHSVVGATDDTPSIACGPASIGPENCIIVWNDVNWNHTIRWAHGHVLGSPDLNFKVVSPVSQAIVSYGTPSVAYRGGTYPWILAVHRGKNEVFTYRKGNGVTDSWRDERVITIAPAGTKITSPAVGAAQSINQAFLYFTASPPIYP